MIDNHTLGILEYPKVIARIREKCLTPYGVEEVDRFAPMFEREPIERRLNEVEQLRDIYRFGQAFPLYNLDDSRDLLHRATVGGSFLEPLEIREILALVEVSISLHNYDRDNRDRFKDIVPYLAQMRAFPELQKEITRAVDEEGQVRNNASVQLRRIRSNLRQAKASIIARLEGILSKSQKHEGWQDDVITQRNDRYVIPVLAGEYKSDQGILHDRSQSGATLYVEPKETVELNNRVNMLFQEERAEVLRILRALTAEIGQRVDALLGNAAIIGKLDALYAAAKLAADTESNKPKLEPDPVFDLHDARHPLLILQKGSPKNVVPLTLAINGDRQAVLITGPNTGGKTIALKTIGLTVALVQTGLLAPLRETSTLGIFKKVYADIGDEQSIELSLSTFSSHIRNISQAVSEVDDHSLALLDEIGAGTDPKEGAALAEAIVLDMVNKGARVIASTHYSQLKTLALDHPEIENASLEFNRETLAPTYRLQMGIPGASYAVEIAGRLGIPESICKHANKLLGSSERSLADLIANLETELKQVRADRVNLTERLAKVDALERKYRSRIDEFDHDIDQRREKALADAQGLLDNSRRELEKLVAEIRKSQAQPEAVRQAHQFIKEAGEQLAHTKRRGQPQRPKQPRMDKFAVGDRVRIISLDREGDLTELIGNDKARVQVGSMTTTVPLRDLERRATQSGRTTTPVAQTPSKGGLNPEIHLMGMTVEEATFALDKFLDEAVVAGLQQVYVVHGKGTGALRKHLTQYLKAHREVDSLRLGNWNEGGAGVTIVKLKT